ncbi:MAG: porphobilinogen synthase [Bdellovibrionaceae bacterium]|nr:porphobilinogen synthase [Pseudobdellovibrionaceae bacterium]
MYLMKKRPRRIRKNSFIRDLVAETSLPEVSQLIYPVFIQEGRTVHQEIKSMPGQYRLSIDLLLQRMATWRKLGLNNYALFPNIDNSLKNENASEALNPDGFLYQAIKQIKDRFPEVNLFTDLALDPFSSDGHDGIIENGKIVNDRTVEVLAQMAILQAQAGADFVCPSDMMDGRVRQIRRALEREGLCDTGIVAYSAKYASSFYGPFRDALDSAPRAGDKKTYQMDFRNSREAMKEIELDIQEGADIVMIKPALSFLDIIAQAKRYFKYPVAAYNVSGEYAMVKAAAGNGWLDENKALVEILTSIKRAGADIIFTYHAVDYAKLRNS